MPLLRCPRQEDTIHYLRTKRGLSFQDACRVAGREDKLNGGELGAGGLPPGRVPGRDRQRGRKPGNQKLYLCRVNNGRKQRRN